jgi:hypothetical protein
VRRELVPVLAHGSPFVEVARFGSLESLRITAVRVVLVIQFNFLLVDIDYIEV